MVKSVTTLTVVCLAFASVLASSAQAVEGHFFDPVLSLTESTVVNSEDEVADPGAAHPEPRFEEPCGTATDSHGDIYASSPMLKAGSIVGGRIDVFNPQGEFLLRKESPGSPCGLAVDSEGNVYSGGIEGEEVDLFEPSAYPPTASTTYSLARTFDLGGPPPQALAVDPSNDHLYLGGIFNVLEYGSAAEGSPPVGEFSIPKGEIAGGNPQLSGIDVYGQDHDIYAAVKMDVENHIRPSRFYVFDGADGHVKCEVLGAEAPEDLEFGLGAPVAVDQSNGDAYLYSIKRNTVYQFGPPDEGTCDFIGTLPKPPTLKGESPFGDIAVDDPLEEGEAGYDSPNAERVYVTSGISSSVSHLFAYRPKTAGEAPKIQAQGATGITETEAVLGAELNPSGLDTTYHFEYLTEAAYLANGESFAGPEAPASVPVPDAEAESGGAFAKVSEPVAGLQAGVAYRFRLVASNCEDEEAEPESCLTLGEGKPGEEGEGASFSTYPAAPVPGPCPNAALRVGASASLPDCRAYELVTPPDTGGHIPTMGMLGEIGYGFSLATPMISADAGSVLFGSNSGALPGLGGSGFYDLYEALRGEDGWHSSFTGMTGAQAEQPIVDGSSPDHRCSLWDVEQGNGRLVFQPSKDTIYLRCSPAVEPSANCAVEAEPEGPFEWLGCGSLGFSPAASVKWISDGARHIVFKTGLSNSGSIPAVQLEECAPPSGVRAIYDRTPGGPTECISVPPAGASAEVRSLFEHIEPTYAGASADGSAVAFSLGGTLYARLDDATTIEVATGKTAFGGFSADGSRAVYLAEPSLERSPRGEIYACEVALGPCAGPEATQEPIRVGEGGESILVNVSADGSHVYFVSPKVLDEAEEGEAGVDNLYMWDGAVHFVAVLDPADLDGGVDSGSQSLGFWIKDVQANETSGSAPANDPSRTTPDGSVMVFQSHAALTGHGSGGHWQVYRYDADGEPGKQVSCLSCDPTGGASSADSWLQVPGGEVLFSLPPLNPTALIPNVSSDGGKVFFQSADRLVSADLDGKLDVYEWEAPGVGGCLREAGCLSLISGGRSGADDYLYGATPNGTDILFLSGDTLLGEDPDGSPSIYDARVDGGFAPPSAAPGECLGEACQPAVSAPNDSTPASAGFEGAGNLSKSRNPRCAKGERRVESRGKSHCVKRPKKTHRRRHHRADANRRAER